jgi:membrane-associated protease RseP (regulator of RpoE activity)
VAGAPENVEIDAAPGGAAIAGDGWSLELSGGVNQEANQPLTFAADQPARVSGDGFMGGTRADVFLFSTPTLLGSVTIADDGTFAADFDIDSALIEAGSHTLQIQGVGADGYVRAANLGVTVAPSELPSLVPPIDDGAGFNWWWLLWIAGMLVVVAGVTRALMEYRRTSLL